MHPQTNFGRIGISSCQWCHPSWHQEYIFWFHPLLPWPNGHQIFVSLLGANILLNNKGEVKIADFGLAKQYTPGHPHNHTTRVCTMWYRAPEIVLGIYFSWSFKFVHMFNLKANQIMTPKLTFGPPDVFSWNSFRIDLYSMVISVVNPI